MINWYLSRLKSMSFAELFFRTRQMIRSRYEKHFCVGKLPKNIGVSLNTNRFYYSQESNKKYPDTFNVFGKIINYNTGEIDWHQDVFSGNRFPLSFSKSINIRRNPGLSAKNVWEVNRLQFLLFIAMDYANTGNQKYLERFMKIMISWIDSNPYLQGVNWYSNIEVNIRLIVWYFCWHLFDSEKLMAKNSDFAGFVRSKWVPAIYMHCIYSYHNPSRYSSSNNHLISEYAGLFIATSLWKFDKSVKWNKYAKSGLEREIMRQHSGNGVNKEEAAEYIQFITDFFLIALAVANNTDNHFSEKYRGQLGKILKYIHDILDVAGNFPNYGDEDDGKCILLDPEDNFNNFRSLLTSGALIYNDPVFKSKSNGIDKKNMLLFGDEGIRRFDEIEDIAPERRSAFYPDEGHFIFRKSDGQNDEVYMHFDAAPLGYLSIAAHGHADALSFILHLDGFPFFVDSGTYTYHTDPEWRNYFIGTLAHNTIRINKQNQATIAGPTLWQNHYKTKILRAETGDESDTVCARHNGYRSIGITHTREITFNRKEMQFIIRDELKTRKNNKYLIEVPFHIHPLRELSQAGPNVFIINNPEGHRRVSLILDNKLSVNLVYGQMTPEIIGWYSASFMQKEKTNTILGFLEAHGDITLITKISIT